MLKAVYYRQVSNIKKKVWEKTGDWRDLNLGQQYRIIMIKGRIAVIVVCLQLTIEIKCF